MDNKQEFNFLTYTPQTLPPAQLWIGSHDNALHEVEQFLQKMLCKNSGCNTCVACMQIREKQHHALMWLHPEKNYTIDQLEDLFAALTFQLEPDELFFFIIQKADFLTPACANKLLQPMEEPPTGYHFIVLAERAELILPTIRSRCAVYSLNSTSTGHETHPIYECFTKRLVPADEFSKIVDTAALNERESIELLDVILLYWMQSAIQRAHPDTSTSSAINTAFSSLCAHPDTSTSSVVNSLPGLRSLGEGRLEGLKREKPVNNLLVINSIISTLEQAHLRPPMPGSSTIFWRNLYLQLYKDLSAIF